MAKKHNKVLVGIITTIIVVGLFSSVLYVGDNSNRNPGSASLKPQGIGETRDVVADALDRIFQALQRLEKVEAIAKDIDLLPYIAISESRLLEVKSKGEILNKIQQDNLAFRMESLNKEINRFNFEDMKSRLNNFNVLRKKVYNELLVWNTQRDERLPIVEAKRVLDIVANVEIVNSIDSVNAAFNALQTGNYQGEAIFNDKIAAGIEFILKKAGALGVNTPKDIRNLVDVFNNLIVLKDSQGGIKRDVLDVFKAEEYNVMLNDLIIVKEAFE